MSDDQKPEPVLTAMARSALESLGGQVGYRVGVEVGKWARDKIKRWRKPK